jgi:hypothetical protein
MRNCFWHLWIANKINFYNFNFFHCHTLIYRTYFLNFSETDSGDEDFETSSPSKLSGTTSDRTDHENCTNIADTEHFSTFTFGYPSTTGGTVPATSDGGSGKVYDKYYDYYFKYYTDKYGGGISDPEAKGKTEESVTKNQSTSQSNFGRGPVSKKASDSCIKSSLSLVTYSGSEDDDE